MAIKKTPSVSGTKKIKGISNKKMTSQKTNISGIPTVSSRLKKDTGIKKKSKSIKTRSKRF